MFWDINILTIDLYGNKHSLEHDMQDVEPKLVYTLRYRVSHNTALFGVFYKGWIKSSGNTSVALKLLYYRK
jgi:hypothetical protein